MTEATQTAAELPIVADTTAATAAASDATPTMNVTLGSPLAPSAAASRAPSCLSLLGPLPVVDSAAALTQLASQMHVLTTPLPTMHAQVCMSTLEESVHAQLLRMDELSSELESLKRASVQANSQILPLIAQKQAAIAPLLQQVAAFDKYARELERHVAYVESRVDQVDAGCRRTAAAESDYAREREAASRTGVAADLLQAEKAVNKLWTSLKVRGGRGDTKHTVCVWSRGAPGHSD